MNYLRTAQIDNSHAVLRPAAAEPGASSHVPGSARDCQGEATITAILPNAHDPGGAAIGLPVQIEAVSDEAPGAA